LRAALAVKVRSELESVLALTDPVQFLQSHHVPALVASEIPRIDFS